MSPFPNAVLIHYGEIALKRKSRHIFARHLKEFFEKKLSRLGISWIVYQPHGYLHLVVPPGDERLDLALKALGELAGVVWFAPAYFEEIDTENPDWERLEGLMKEMASGYDPAGRTFRVQANRADKKFPLPSPEIERRLGGAIFMNTDWNKVDLNNPDQTFYINIQQEGVFIHSTKYKGLGGLPVGSAGRILTLLSGGIDSPVAAYLMARRGCDIDFVHFTATARQLSRPEQYKIAQLAQHISHYTGRIRLYLLPYTHFDTQLMGYNLKYQLVLFRRFMARVSEQLAHELGAKALVTGDSLAQVASQTLDNLTATSQATDMPILRPLLAYDKLDIVNLAEKIGTYDLSLKPYKDCCSLISRKPRTDGLDKALVGYERKFMSNYDELMQKTLADRVCLTYEFGTLVGNHRMVDEESSD